MLLWVSKFAMLVTEPQSRILESEFVSHMTHFRKESQKVLADT